ncbi:MAG: ParA family protein [Clostridiales bacterium]|jgi:MinD-like ATPase involved in chromosome partitioning or flagellar assembly|nr:ParA family protein [Eubacteriales bacterium]MDH7567352.1 ParA family protein [Clostridiales bacterium]
MINFKIDSIFSRKTGHEQQSVEPEPDNQVLAVWGSPSSGKTVVSVKLARHLASKRKNVALVLCDMTAPPLPCICPPSDLECKKSLGSILAATHITDNLIRQNCMLHRKQSYITIIGMLKGENVFTYPPYTAQQASELIEHLRNIAPYVIIDCGSIIASDILSAVALMESDAVLRLVNCDLKSISYMSSQLPLLMDRKWDTDKQYKVASNVKQYEAMEHMEQVLNGVAFKIPHSQEVEQQYLEGDLFRDLVLKDSRGFRKEIKKISREVFGI